ncbi:hypothetical protein [Hugenholtzia roseola]|uniref:hypothetical protein n=1 Tax=Hugenholtzia roseola TaxID=1002 RepID=UPI00040E665F|nr:hypothetical protein [Hugenholtzia roseola]
MKKYKVFIKQIDWFDKENPEADVLFEINGAVFWAFCHPCNFKENEIAEVYFDFLEDEVSELIFWTENKNCKVELIQSENNRCRYYCYGQLKSINPVTVNCGLINFYFKDWISNSSVIGNYVYFVIERFDIQKVIK